MDNLLRVAEIAKILRVCTKTVINKMRSGQLPCTEIAGVLYITEKQLEKAIHAGEKRKYERAV